MALESPQQIVELREYVKKQQHVELDQQAGAEKL